MEKIMSIGGGGFIGTNFYKQWSKDYDIVIYDSADYPCTLTNGLWDMESPVWFKGDIRDQQRLAKAIDEINPRFIINFAAKTHVDRSIHDSDTFLDTNTVGVENILKAIIGKKIRLVHMSTDEVYGDTELWDSYEFNEEDPLRTSSPYSASKGAADCLIKAYHRTYGVDAITIRPTNNYGPYQYPEKLIPYTIKRILSGQMPVVYGEGLNEREWLHTDDTCRGIEMAMRYGEPGEIYNLGTGFRDTNIAIINLITKDNKMIEFINDRPGHDMRYAVDHSKMKDLGWSAKRLLADSIDEVVDWYKQRADLILSLDANKHIK